MESTGRERVSVECGLIFDIGVVSAYVESIFV